MDSFVARQAIFDRDLNVWGYELLFRSGIADTYDATDGEAATASVIANGFFEPGFENLLHGVKASVNFDRALLVGNVGRTLPLPKGTIVEVLETVEPDDEVMAACAELKERGFLIALDDYTGDPKLDRLVEIADLLKIDVLAVDGGPERAILDRAKARGLLTVAEKVETREAWERAREAGYDYFQGYFFAQPIKVGTHQIPAAMHSALSLVREMQADEIDFGRVETIVKREVGFSHRLLRYLNSAAFRFPVPISSIRQALDLLGENEIRRWVTLTTFSRLGSGKPLELVTQSMVRGRFCEMVGQQCGLPVAGDAFLLGMFSLLPALLDRPMSTLLDELGLAPHLAAPLCGTAPPGDSLAGLLRLVRDWEAGNWEGVRKITDALAIPAAAVGQAYIDAVRWADQTAGAGGPAASGSEPAGAPQAGHSLSPARRPASGPPAPPQTRHPRPLFR
jgi:c-di-GMP-related signal transduction protein